MAANAQEAPNIQEPQEPQEPLVSKTQENGVVYLTLNRPRARNALSQRMIEVLLAEFDAIAADPGAFVVVLAGAGPAFCSGHDLKEMRATGFDPAYAEKLFATCGKLMQRIVSLPQPVIARVHGIATAAGTQLVATCDLAIAADTTRFATPGVNIGFFCSTPMVALSRNVSHKHAMQMLLTGDFIDAPTALRFGLVNDIVPEQELDAAVNALAAKIASKSRHTLAVGKEAFYRQAAEPQLAAAYTYAQGVMVNNLQSLDAREGISAFIDKRPPVWCNS
ncbi:MAG: enoyl-CoA hydratase [Candidatus Accumulibacter sp.]|jgi:enoyl-CoA hydratase/carnithine racemase|nr:enoyl-CoA hydratase [Accumulibacter sp.]